MKSSLEEMTWKECFITHEIVNLVLKLQSDFIVECYCLETFLKGATVEDQPLNLRGRKYLKFHGLHQMSFWSYLFFTILLSLCSADKTMMMHPSRNRSREWVVSSSCRQEWFCSLWVLFIFVYYFLQARLRPKKRADSTHEGIKGFKDSSLCWSSASVAHAISLN